MQRGPPHNKYPEPNPNTNRMNDLHDERNVKHEEQTANSGEEGVKYVAVIVFRP